MHLRYRDAYNLSFYPSVSSLRPMVYSAPYSKIKDMKLTVDVIKEYSFATVITPDANELHMTHLPVILEGDENEFVLLAHLARQNPHSRALKKELVTTVIFH